jgi:hypothetical protein
VRISSLPKVEPLSDLKEEQKYRYEIIYFNAAYEHRSESGRIMDYVRLRKRICMSHLEDAYNKILAAKSDNEKFVYGRKLREYGWLAYYLIRFHALMYKEHVKPNCKVNLSVPSEVHILDAIVDSYLSGKSKLKDGESKWNRDPNPKYVNFLILSVSDILSKENNLQSVETCWKIEGL